MSRHREPGVTDAIEVPLRFTRAGGPRTRAVRRGRRLEYEGGDFFKQRVRIRNARPLAGGLSLDREGFVLVQDPAAVTDFHDEANVRAAYYPEVENLVREVTGAARVLVFDHTLRSGDEEERAAGQIREPVNVVHNDYTENSAVQRVRDLLPTEAHELLRHRFQVIQVWRPLAGPVQRSPLALCDAASLSPQNLIRIKLHYPDRVGEIYHLGYNPGQRWFYFPNMRPDEALVFKVYDSATDGRARFTAHGAFHHPATPPGAAPRQSIEVRTLAFYT